MTRTGIELLVGQKAAVNLQMVPATLQEIGHGHRRGAAHRRTSSTLGSNVDPRQMQELPVNGRNFVDLTLLAPGSRQNASSTTSPATRHVGVVPAERRRPAGHAEPDRRLRPAEYSRDAIAEFEFVANRFDATQGGSSGTLVNAITKSGTNALSRQRSPATSATTRSSARTSSQNRVLPYSDTSSSAGRSAARS